eukprot:364883-Chlamydomonas_euryale.AAC.4
MDRPPASRASPQSLGPGGRPATATAAARSATPGRAPTPDAGSTQRRPGAGMGSRGYRIVRSMAWSGHWWVGWLADGQFTYELNELRPAAAQWAVVGSGCQPPRQKSGFDGDPSHLDAVCELAVSSSVVGVVGVAPALGSGSTRRHPEVGGRGRWLASPHPPHTLSNPPHSLFPR